MAYPFLCWIVHMEYPKWTDKHFFTVNFRPKGQ
jgi:hypothetical protein